MKRNSITTNMHQQSSTEGWHIRPKKNSEEASPKQLWADGHLQEQSATEVTYQQLEKPHCQATARLSSLILRTLRDFILKLWCMSLESLCLRIALPVNIQLQFHTFFKTSNGDTQDQNPSFGQTRFAVYLYCYQNIYYIWINLLHCSLRDHVYRNENLWQKGLVCGLGFIPSWNQLL